MVRYQAQRAPDTELRGADCGIWRMNVAGLATGGSSCCCDVMANLQASTGSIGSIARKG